MASQMVTRPSERELVKIFIAGLLPKYNAHMKYLGLESFKRTYDIGVDIEDDLMKAPAAPAPQTEKWKGKRPETTHKVHEVNALEAPQGPRSNNFKSNAN